MPRAIGLDMCKLPTEDLIGSNFPVTLHLMMLHSVTTTVLPNYCPRPLLVESRLLLLWIILHTGIGQISVRPV